MAKSGWIGALDPANVPPQTSSHMGGSGPSDLSS
eukprot:CAMPEP_0174363630 /NCGR_PEP_ID=MMETSP0811_2-20130205/69583_1 /TAXON_ID=73025 ORGANISM="Eutreptiella gymnastica-like, Strain CCMP1594" /NCGR_SAMPLE_ID=MMETSP0811_2 /ASSEMBLY_ACC=CAM_ASM_000667 /LENGTH=33 /DNA_ID= /DNA_START= /DNA_END= /DNA_ORIENTATION=